mgnify:CR=1 FL=1
MRLETLMVIDILRVRDENIPFYEKLNEKELCVCSSRD